MLCAGLDVGEYVCGGPTAITEINTQVESIAFAIAEAFAEVTAFCSAQGNADVRAEGYAFAQERATAIGDAIADIYATSSVCERCDAAVAATSTAARELVAEAVAEAWTEVRCACCTRCVCDGCCACCEASPALHRLVAHGGFPDRHCSGTRWEPSARVLQPLAPLWKDVLCPHEYRVQAGHGGLRRWHAADLHLQRFRELRARGAVLADHEPHHRGEHPEGPCSHYGRNPRRRRGRLQHRGHQHRLGTPTTSRSLLPQPHVNLTRIPGCL